MSAAALALVLAAALLHALWNVVAKKTGGDARFALMAALLLVVVWAPLGVWFGWQALPRRIAEIRPTLASRPTLLDRRGSR